jgi:class 3 adenylate cyclase
MDARRVRAAQSARLPKGTQGMAQILDPPLFDQGLAALERREWRAAYDLLSRADAAGELGYQQLEPLARAAWWAGRLNEAIEARERGYAGALKADDPIAAAYHATGLIRDNLMRNQQSQASAWRRRAERLLEDVPEMPVHGWLGVTRGWQELMLGQLDAAKEDLSKAIELGRRLHIRDLEDFALAEYGMALVWNGEVADGLAALDEATVGAIAGELEPQTAGAICCTAISASTSLGDWQRAAQWTDAQDRWCRRENISGFPGMCRLYRAEAKRQHGAWLEAESEARRAADELPGWVPAAAGAAYYEIGLIRLRRGDLPGAEEALQKGYALGRFPEPALSLVRLAEGRTDEALVSIRRALEEPEPTSAWSPAPSSEVGRLAILPAAVDIALAAGDIAFATTAADELDRTAPRFGTASGMAAASASRGAVLLATGDVPSAKAKLRQAVKWFADADAPYEKARAQVVLAAAYRAEGADDRALLELQAARAEFERLGARIDREQADRELTALGTSAPVSGGRRERIVRAFVFTDIVDSTKLAELLGDDAWHDVIAWHNAALRSVVAEFGGEEIKTIGDGFFLAFDDTDRAIEAAMAMQRRLAEHRQTSGFAPAVRIGIHQAEADRTGLDYLGTGVNTAARVGAQASGGEVLVSATTLTSARTTYPQSNPRSLALKGLTEPVDVVTIDWR